MKKTIKTILGIVVVVCVIIVTLWGSIIYVSEYKVTTVDISVSPDGKYELTLQAIGEADFPFGSASGRLVLKEGKNKISKTDFELHDDGKSIRGSSWDATWHEDYVEVILSGEEQFDEQVILYFDGKKEIKQITDEEKFTETENVNEIEVINSQAIYESESENQEDVELGEKDTNLDDDSNSIEKIYEYMITEQSFDISINDWGDVSFVSCLPMPDSEGTKNPYTDVSFYLISDDKVVYRFPYVNILENDTYAREDNIRQRGMIDLSYGGISFVMFTDVNGDANDDVVIGIFYCTGIGPQGAIPFIEVRIYEDKGSEFVYNESLCENLWELPYDITAEDVKSFLSK